MQHNRRTTANIPRRVFVERALDFISSARRHARSTARSAARSPRLPRLACSSTCAAAHFAPRIAPTWLFEIGGMGHPHKTLGASADAPCAVRRLHFTSLANRSALHSFSSSFTVFITSTVITGLVSRYTNNCQIARRARNNPKHKQIITGVVD